MAVLVRHLGDIDLAEEAVQDAFAEVDGPGAALSLVDGLDLVRHHLFHAVRADLLRRLGRVEEAALAYGEAIARTDNEVERDFLRGSRRKLSREQPRER